jgi:anaerobic magnesium-protoporphyrin IX monomethyl ester cyclase
VLRHEGIDYLCLGEGEAALLDFVEALQVRALGRRRTGIPNHVGQGRHPAAPLRNPIEPLDALPFLARDIARRALGRAASDDPARLPVSVHLLRRAHVRQALRRAIPRATAAGEASRACSPNSQNLRASRTAQLRRSSSTIPSRSTTAWVREFCKVYGKRIRGPVFVERARRDGQRESAAGTRGGRLQAHRLRRRERQRARAARDHEAQPPTNQRFRDVFRWTREAGIMATANYIIGTPGESRAEMAETIALHHELQPVDFGFFVFYPVSRDRAVPGVQANGYLPEDYLTRPANHRESISESAERHAGGRRRGLRAVDRDPRGRCAAPGAGQSGPNRGRAGAIRARAATG